MRALVNVSERLGLHPSHRAAAEAIGYRSTFAASNGAIAVGALAVGSVAIGAVAIGRLAIRRLAIEGAAIKRLRIDELEVGSLTVEWERHDGMAMPTIESTGPGRLAAGSSKLSHVDLVVSSLERSLPFYVDLLGPLGWDGHDTIVGERGEEIHYISVAGLRRRCPRPARSTVGRARSPL